MSYIIPKLLLCSAIESACDEYSTHDVIINCTRQVPFAENQQKAIKIRIPIEDHREEVDCISMFQIIKDGIIFRKMAKALFTGHKVTVHCWAGIQRSPAFVVCFLLYLHARARRPTTPKHMIDFVMKKHSRAFMGAAPNFVNTINMYYELLSST